MKVKDVLMIMVNFGMFIISLLMLIVTIVVAICRNN